MERFKGIFWAAVSSSTFGLVPFFTLLLIESGYSSFEVLTYRWGVAAITLWLFGLLAGRRFRLSRPQIGIVFILSLFRAATSLSLIVAYQWIASGVASTIHFMYPLAVTLAMICVFHERANGLTFSAIGLSIAGAILLSGGNLDFSQGHTWPGILAAILSVFFYSAYIIGVKRSSAAEIEPTALTTWVMAFGALFFLICCWLTDGIRFETAPKTWLWILGLALPATALSNMALVQAIRRIGPTLTSIFGALEPLTAVIIGCLFFNEAFTFAGAVGMTLILTAVTAVSIRQQNA